MKRRELIKSLTILPVAGGILGSGFPFQSALAAPALAKRAKKDIFEELGLRTFINCHGTITTKSGCVMQPEVLETIQYVSQHYVMMEDLERKVGARLASLLGSESAMVTAGATSAMLLGTAGCITGLDQNKIRLLPEYVGERPEVIIQKSHRFGYDHAIRNTGVKIVEVEGAEEMQRAINKNTVMMFFYNAAGTHSVDREEFVAIGKRNNIPTFNDASADVPPVENFFKYIKMGFDMVTYSGGKGIMGPQSTGVLLGRKDLIEAALNNKMTMNNSSNTIGRCMKVNKEEILGLLVAVENYLKRDHQKEYQMWISRIERIQRGAESVTSVKGETLLPKGPANYFPYLNLTWDEKIVKMNPAQVADALRAGTPSIEVVASPAAATPAPATAGSAPVQPRTPPRTPVTPSLKVYVMVMLEKEVEIVARRLKEVLSQATV